MNRDKTAAAKILLEQGWTFDEVIAVLGEPYKSLLNFPPGIRGIPTPSWEANNPPADSLAGHDALRHRFQGDR